MKKLLLIALAAALLFACQEEVDPFRRYKGCVVVYKNDDSPAFGNVKIKLSDSLARLSKEDYIWIGVPKYDRDRLHIGDTIK